MPYFERSSSQNEFFFLISIKVSEFFIITN